MTTSPQISLSVGATVLVGGKLLSGTELTEYAKHKGLCPKCVQHKTHKRIKKRLGILRSEADWEPITEKDKEAGNYVVYKGYCLQPTCWTLAEAKGMLGETPTLRSSSSMRSRTVTPGRERPSSASVDDCSSVAHSEITYPCNASLSTVSPQGQYIRSTSSSLSSRTLTPGRGRVESRMSTSPHHSGTVSRSTSVRQNTSYSLREIDLGYESSQSRTSDNSSMHSRDISLFARQSSASSIISDISDRSSHRRRISRKLLDVKVHESPREVRPAMFYRQPTDSSDSSDDDSDKILEKIVNTDSVLKEGATSKPEHSIRTNSRRRASIGNLIQSTPRLLNNILLETRGVAVSTRELRNYESTELAKENKEKHFRIAPECAPDSQVDKVKPSPSEDNSSHSRRLRFPYGKGKSSSNIHNRQKQGTAVRRSSISNTDQVQNHEYSPSTSNGQFEDTTQANENKSVNVQTTPEYAPESPSLAERVKPSSSGDSSAHSRRLRFPYGKGKSSSNIHSQKKVGTAVRRSSISYTTVQNNEEYQSVPNGQVASEYVAVTPLRSRQHISPGKSESFITPKSGRLSVSPSPDDKGLKKVYVDRQSPSSDTSDAKRRSNYQIDGSIGNQSEKSNSSVQRRAPISLLAQSSASISPLVKSPQHNLSNLAFTKQRGSLGKMSNYTDDGNDRNHGEKSQIVTRRRASISHVSSISPVNVTDREVSPKGSFSNQNISSRTMEHNNRNQDQKSTINSRRRASISFISQPSDNLIQSETTSRSNSSTRNRDRVCHQQSQGQTDYSMEVYEKKQTGRSENQTRRRASISYISQSSIHTIDDRLAPQTMSSNGGLTRHRSIGKLQNIHHKRLSDSGIAATSPATLYKRYSYNDASDDDVDADESLTIHNFHRNNADDCVEISDEELKALTSRAGDASDSFNDSHNSSHEGKEDFNKSLGSMKGRSASDIVILRHLYIQVMEKVSPSGVEGSTIVSTENLWRNLHARYGDLSSTANSVIDKISTLVNVLDQTQDNECYEKCWALLSHLTTQKIGDDQHSSDIKLRILRTMSNEFDKQNFDYNAKLHAAVTISNILTEEKAFMGTTATIWFKTLTTNLRLKWISVLSDVLHFRDFNHVVQRKGTIEVVNFVCSLLNTENINEDDARHVQESCRLLNKLNEISFSILTAVAFGSEESDQDVPVLCGAVFGLLASVTSRATISAIDERHVESLKLLHAVMEKYASEDILSRGLLFAKQLVTKVKTSVSEFDETANRTLATTIYEMAQTSLLFEQKNPNPTMILAAIKLVTLLIERDDQLSHIITDLAVLQRPIIVEAIIRLIDTSSDAQHADEGFLILLCLVTKNPISGSQLRNVPSIACRLVMWLTRYRNISVQEHICLILEYLVASEDYSLGQEISSVGGLVVLSELFQTSAQSCSNGLSQAAARALVGVLAMVDTRILNEYNAILNKFIVDSMSFNVDNVELQMAGLGIIQCLCLRCDSVSGFGRTVLPVVLKSMENHFGNVPLLTTCCTIIRIISAKLEDWTVVVETDAFKIVVNTLLVHPTSTKLIFEGMATIKDLARKESFQEYCNAEDAEIAIVSLLPLHSQNPDAVALIFASLNNLAVNTRTSKVAPMQLDVLHFILSALNAFRDNHHVTRNACLLLKSYTYNADNLKTICSYREPVISILSTCSSSPHTETRDRARYIIKKVEGAIIRS